MNFGDFPASLSFVGSFEVQYQERVLAPLNPWRALSLRSEQLRLLESFGKPNIHIEGAILKYLPSFASGDITPLS